MDWLRVVGGRLKSDYRYSKDVVYNNFVFPQLDDNKLAKLDELGVAVLEARSLYPDESFATLYDPVVMPAELSKAHKAIDAYVDKLYRDEPFNDWEQRVRFLLTLHREHEEAAHV